jgi:apolipoprotein N-acyltransferase
MEDCMERLANSVMLSWGIRRAAIALFAGAIGALALPPFGIFLSMFIAFPLLVWLLDGAAAEQGGGFFRHIWPSFYVGWLFGLGYFVAGLWWVEHALLADGGEFAWAIPLAVVGLPAVLAIFYGLAASLARLYWPDGIGRIAMLAVAFGLVEWLRSFALTGFPWNAVGYAAMPFPMMMQPVHWIGVNGMNLLAVLVFAMPALLGTAKHQRMGVILATLLLAADFGYGFYAMRAFDRLPSTGEINVRLVQPGTRLDEGETDAGRNAIFDRLLKLTAAPPQDGAKKPDVIIWPETAIPFILTENQAAFSQIAEALSGKQALISGTVREEDRGPGSPRRYYNSVYVFDAQGQIVSAADKVHLVPFGEYLPFEGLLRNLGLDTVALPGGYTAAVSHNLLTLPGGAEIYPLICYEAIFPGEITDDAARAEALLNLTNDTWFGRTPGPYQHFHQAQVTAVELGIPMIRSANSGISALIAANGEIISALDINRSGSVDATLTLRSVPFLSNDQRQINFWLLIAIIFLVVPFSRVSFISNMN